jgi:2,5-diketo-D-gluconate reductase B
MKTIKLNSQALIPVLGFGTWQLQGQTCYQAVRTALEIGYRHLDTARAYENHQMVGRAMADSGLPRKDIFLTSKVWLTDLHKKDLIAACHQALKELKTDYLDLYLIHWPNREIPIKESLEAMNQLKDEGLIKAIGVSNFTIHHLEDALKIGIEITNNQVEFHPSFNQKKLKDFCDRHHLSLTAYSPIGRGEDLKLAVIKRLADKYKRPPSQVILNWLIQKNIIAIPKATSREHIEDNFKTLEWQLDPKDVELIDNIGTNNRLIRPDFADFEY